MNRRQFLAATGTASITALAGCGGDGGGDDVSEEDIGAEVSMTDDNTFDPYRVSIDAGQAVRWTNETGEERTLRSNTNTDFSAEWDPAMDVELADGESHTHLFEESGVYTYHDAVRTWSLMCGAVAVGDNSEDDIGDLACDAYV